MPLLMQLDGPRPPQLLGIWSDIWGGIENVGSAVSSTVSDAWASITDRRVRPSGVHGMVEILSPSSGVPSTPPPTYPTPPPPPIKRISRRGVRGLGIFDPVGYATIHPFLTFVAGVGIGVFLATRKGRKR